jgi:hypothetical protein
MFGSLRAAAESARRHGDLYFAALLPQEVILEALGEASSLWQGWIYTPAVTLWVFLAQCLSADHSCREAVAQLAAWRAARGLRSCSADTGGYCTARAQLPEAACQALVRRSGRDAETAVPDEWLWHGRRVRVVDGSTITMPDTPENQAEYPQLTSQRPGCGFPIARICVVFSLAVGTVLEAAIGPYQGKRTGENSLFRTLHEALEPDDVVLADRYYGGWFDIALLAQRGIDVVVRKHQLRATDFRTGVRLGKDDQQVVWPKPARPAWMTPEAYAALPEELTLREVRVRVRQRGFRTQQLVVVTTLADHEAYSADAIAELYRRRWDAELHLRSLKTVLQMDHLRCRAPDRVRNEFRMHLLAYNLLRGTIATVARRTGLRPSQISFKGTLQTLGHFLPLLTSVVSLDAWHRALIAAVATHVVGTRPNRCEPRLTKRRPKKFKHLREPRQNYRRRMR